MNLALKSIALAVPLMLASCSTSTMTVEQTQALHEVFNDKKYQQGITQFTPTSDGSHIISFRINRQTVQQYVRKYAAYCIRSGKSVPVQVTQVTAGQASSASRSATTIQLSCQ